MGKYILAVDEGTTDVRSILFDENLNIVSVAQREISRYFPFPGWVEQDAMEIYANQYACMTECVAKNGTDPSLIAAVGITNQRETTVVWDKNTGRPIYNAVVWQCRRTADICRELVNEGLEEYIKENTGLPVDAYFSGTKIKWILDNVQGAREKAEKGELLFGNIDTWLLWKLTGKHITDRTNASRTMLYNLNTDTWDENITKALGIPLSMLPEIKSSSEIYGYTAFMGANIPVSGIAGDQQSALFGQRCFNEGEIKNTYGTGCFLLLNTGNKKIKSKNGLITSVAATLKGEQRQFVSEGSVFTAGAVIQWIRDEMRFITDSADTEYFANKVKDTGGVYVVPAFSGLGAPYWNPSARGIITGITFGTGRNHIIRAALESLAYQTDDVIKAMEADSGRKITSLKVDGGASQNNFLMQFQADISGIRVKRTGTSEATALGAAMLAGLGAGMFADRESIPEIKEGKEFLPDTEGIDREKLLKGWHEAVSRANL